MAFKLAFEGVVCKDVDDRWLFADHDANRLAEFFFDRLLDPRRERFFGGVVCQALAYARASAVEGDIAAVDVGGDVLKGAFLEHGFEFQHFYHRVPADIYAAEQGDISHLKCGHIDHKSVTNIRSNGPVVSFFDLGYWDDLDVGRDVVLGAVIEHLLRFLDPADA